MRPIAIAGAAAAALCGGPHAAAQTPPSEDVPQELERLRRRVETLERQHVTDQQRIEGFESELDRLRSQQAPEPIDEARARETAARVNAAIEQADARAAAGGGGLGAGNQLNPQITLFFDMGFSLSTSDDPAFNRFNLREVELDFRAAVTPWADAVGIFAIAEEVTPLPGGSSEIETNFEVEEAYINFHTLPGGLAVKGGKFRDAFGRNNLLHTHDLPQVDRPLAVQAFFGSEFSSIGAQASWLVPNPWDTYIELVGELVNAQGGGDEGPPVLGGPDPADPAVLAHLSWFGDVGEYGSLDLGGSYLYSPGADTGVSNLSTYGFDGTLELVDPSAPDHRSLLIQGEVFWNEQTVAGAPATDHETLGFYAFVQWQFDQNWYAGVRYDYTEFPDLEFRPPGDHDWAISPYLTWYFTEFLRFRVEYQHLESRQSGAWSAEENFFFELTFSIGAHPAHPYWVNR